MASYIGIMHILMCTIGNVRRRCIMDNIWEEYIECFREETRILFDQVTEYNYYCTYISDYNVVITFQATNLSLSINELNVTERISQTSNIATALVNITTPTQEAIYAEDINLAVEIVSTLNKQDHLTARSHEQIDIGMYYYYSVTETVVTNLTANDTFFEVSILVQHYE